MNRKELSAAVADAAARTEAARAGIEVARAGIEAARQRQEAATARFEEIQSDAAERNEKLDGLLTRCDKLIEEMQAGRAKADAEREEERVWRAEYLRRQEKMFQDFFKRAEALVAEGTRNTERILAKIEDQGEDIRAMKDALLKLIDRFPPPPHLRSA